MSSHLHAGYRRLRRILAPEDYFDGFGEAPLATPYRVLMFCRQTRQTLQQEALQHRSHHRFVLIMNLGTKGHVHVDNRLFPLTPGQALLILPYQFHHFSRLAASDIAWLFCTFECAAGHSLESLRDHVLTLSSASLAARDVLVDDWLALAEGTCGGTSGEQRVQAALLRLLVLLQEELQRSAPDLPPEPRDSLLRSVNRLMAERHGSVVQTADVAEELGMSATCLRMQFKRSAGVTLGQYLCNYRINRAMALLRTTDLPIAHVAEEAGFGSHQAFCRLFRNKTGQTPFAYRRGR